MPSVQRFASATNSAAAAAAVTASSVRPSAAIESISAQRAGGGRLLLEGSYTGHEAAQVQIEIAAGGQSVRASAPQFTGVGNGTLEIKSVAADAPLQEWTLTCADLGIATQHARLDIQGVCLRARAAGAAGNTIRITVTERLHAEKTLWALPEAWAASTESQAGEQWNFGALPLSPKGEVPEDAPRLRFGLDPQVYRQWREYKDGAWHFGFSPALVRDIPAGALVHAITGGYEVLIEDTASGVQEMYGDTAAGQLPIVTLYDLLGALAASALLEVVGVATADRAIGGMAAIDLPLRTSAWLLGVAGDKAPQQISVPAAAPTQTITVQCVNADRVGAERWSVKGTVSGEQAPATTAEEYSSAALTFTIPRRKPLQQEKGAWGFTFEPAARDEDEGLPSVCIRPFVFGVNATPKSLTFRYSQRPPAECNCADMPTPIIPMRYLGYEDEMSIDDPNLKARLDALYEWRRTFTRQNTAISAASSGSTVVDGGRPGGYRFTLSAMSTEGTLRQSTTLTSTQLFDSAQEAVDAGRAALEAGGSVPAGTVATATITIGGAQVTVGPIYTNGTYGLQTSSVEMPLYAGQTVTSQQQTEIPATTVDYNWPLRYLAFHRDLDIMEAGCSIALTCLFQIYDSPEALALWDALWEDIKADLQAVLPAQEDLKKDAHVHARFTDRWQAEADCVLLAAGILPKSDANISAGGCWRDAGDAMWWRETSGQYLPAFTNEAYISSRRDPDTGKPYSTQEFGFGLVVACPERLKEGDTIHITIDAQEGARPYQVGDEFTVQTVAAAPAFLAGGVDGTDEQTWSVAGSTSGALPDLIVPTTGSGQADYTAAGVTARLALGGISHALGDQFTFAVEAGQWRWRRAALTTTPVGAPLVGAQGETTWADWGDWSALQDIPPEGVAPLADGLAVRFAAGAAPSFVPGDAATFHVHQPWAASHLACATADPWGWEGDSAQATVDLGEVRRVEAVALAHYWLPAGATVTLEYSEDGENWGSAPLDVSRPVAWLWLGEQARYLRVSVANAEGGHIGWLWAGEPLALDHHASQCTRTRRWALARGDGYNAGSLYAGAGEAWSLAWQPQDTASSRLLQGDIERLLPLLEHAAATDEPLLFLPHHKHPEEAALCRFEADALEIHDIHEWQTDDAGQRLLSASLTLEPYYA